MIKALLLIFDPVRTWERIAATRRSWVSILVWYVLPLVVLTAAGEGYGLTHWPRRRAGLMQLHVLPLNLTVVFETAQAIVWIAIVFIAAKLIKSLGETFHGRHSFTQTFTVAAYGLSPVFLLHLLDAWPAISPWVSWGIGMSLSIATLYHGLPRVMQPDPPHALGLYFMSSLLLTIVTGLARFVTAWFIQGKFSRVDAVLAKLAALLPF